MKNLLILLCFCYGINVTGQGNLVSSDQSGIMLGAELSSHRYKTLIGAFAGYSFQGKVDIGIAYKRGSLSEFHSYNDVGEWGISSSFDLYVLRQDYSYSPLSLSFGGQYEIYNMTDTHANTTPLSGKNKIYELNTRVFTQVAMTDHLGFHPYLKIAYVNSEMKFNSVEDGISGNKQNFVKTTLGLPMSFTANRTDKLVFTPALSYSKQGTAFQMSLGILLADGNVGRRCGRYGCPILR